MTGFFHDANTSGAVQITKLALQHLAYGAAGRFFDLAQVDQALGLAHPLLGPWPQGTGRQVLAGWAHDKATGVSPHCSEGCPTTAASCAAGCSRSTVSPVSPPAGVLIALRCVCMQPSGWSVMPEV